VYCYLAISAQRGLTLIIKSVSKELFIVEERIELALVGFQNLSCTYTIKVFRVQATDTMAANTKKLPSFVVVPGDTQPFIQKRRLCSVRSRRL
jgi:hypothetical protein